MPFPAPDLTVQKFLDQGEPLDSLLPGGRVWRTYQALWWGERRRLDARVRKLPESPLRGQLEQKLAMADGFVSMTTGSLSKYISLAVKTVAEIDAEIDKPRSVVANLYLQSAIGLLDTQIVKRAAAKDDKVLEVFRRIFGDQTNQAIERFHDIVAGLKAIDQRTNGTNLGFVHDRGLPSEMTAVANGHGAQATISVGDAALNGSTGMVELASQLAHEGSHALPTDVATIDIVYRTGTVHYLLEPFFAVRNAASFEQVVLDVLGTATPNSELIAARSRPLLGSARLVVASRITRTWLRAWDFSRGATVPDGMEKYLSDLPPRECKALVSAYMTRLYERAKEMMDRAYELEVKSASDSTSQSAMASLIEELLLRTVDATQPSVPYYPGNLNQLVLEIEQFDRQDCVSLMTKFYTSFT